MFCLYDEKDLDAMTGRYPSHAQGVHESPLDVIKEEQSTATVLENRVIEDTRTHSLGAKDVELSHNDLEKNKKNNEFSFSNPAFQTTDEPQTVFVLNEHSDPRPRAKTEEEPRKENEFSFSNPAFKQSDEGEISQERNRLDGDPQHETLLAERQSNRSDSSGFSEGYASSPETESVYSIQGSFTENKPRTGQADYMKEETDSQTRPRFLSSRRSRGSSFTKETDTSYTGVSVINEEVNEHDLKSGKTSKTWSDWFKTPMFYKVFKLWYSPCTSSKL